MDCCIWIGECGMSRRNDCRRSRFGWLDNLTLDIKGAKIFNALVNFYLFFSY